MSETVLKGINKLRPWILGVCLTAVVKLVTLSTQSIVHEELKEFVSRAEYNNAWRAHSDWGATVIRIHEQRLDKLETLAVQTHDNAVALAKLQEDVTWIREALVRYHVQGSSTNPFTVTARIQ